MATGRLEIVRFWRGIALSRRWITPSLPEGSNAFRSQCLVKDGEMSWCHGSSREFIEARLRKCSNMNLISPTDFEAMC